ncbi:MAG: phage holin family protein [Candidatus Peregrinibacteria bacterium]
MRWFFQDFIFGIIANALALLGVAYLLGDMGFSITPIWGYVVIGAMVGFVNAVVKPIITLLSLPLIFLTMGLFLAVINGMLLFAIEYLFENILLNTGIVFTVGSGWLSYLIAAALLSLLNSITHFFLAK